MGDLLVGLFTATERSGDGEAMNANGCESLVGGRVCFLASDGRRLKQMGLFIGRGEVRAES